MKKFSILFVTLILFSMTIGAQVTERCFHLDKVQFLQQRQDFWRSHSLYSTTARPMSMMTGGYYNLTELNYGFGLGMIAPPYSQYFAGITTVNGLRFGNGLALGIGVGYFKYNEGYDVPLYLDPRFFMGSQRIKFFVALPGGFLVNFKDFKDYSRVFANPSVGLTVPLAKSMHLSFSTGLFTQYTLTKPHNRDSFINMKLGLLFGK